ncbi:hypothetical protein ACSTLM_01230, partial [Vibrio parahaemolyticus]
DAVAGEHPAQRDRAEIDEQVGEKFTVHVPTLIAARPDTPAAARWLRSMVDEDVDTQRWLYLIKGRERDCTLAGAAAIRPWPASAAPIRRSRR